MSSDCYNDTLGIAILFESWLNIQSN